MQDTEAPALFLLDCGELRFFPIDAEDAPEEASECVLAPSLALDWSAPPEPDTGAAWTYSYSLDTIAFTHCRSQAFRMLEGAHKKAADAFLEEHYPEFLNALALRHLSDNMGDAL